METFNGSATLQSFAPGWCDPGLLEKTLVGRKDLVDRLEELALDGAGGPNKHQRLIVGARGSGKTHVLRVLRNRLWSNGQLRERLLIIYLLEDELGVASFLDFVIRILRAIVRWYPENDQLSHDLEAIYNLPLGAQESHAVQLLLEIAGGRGVLIIMENLGITFDKKMGFGRDGQQALRDLVQQHPIFMIFASSQALVEGTKDLEAPFYGFFKTIHLHRLSLKEAMTFLRTIASARGDDEAVHFLETPKGRGRMRAIYNFTGGNHRLLVTFYEFLTADSISNLSELFITDLNKLKSYYQEQMRSLSAQQQKILQFLSLHRQPQIVKNIARGCLAAPNTISSQLKDLHDKNFVSRIERGRESYYEITEALFRICHEADLEPGAPARLFVDFLANLYTAEELRFRWRGFTLLSDRLGTSGAVPFSQEAQFYHQALFFYHPGLTTPEKGSTGTSKQQPESLQDFFHEMEQANAYREIVEISRHLGDEKDVFVLNAQARAYTNLGDVEKAQAAAREALRKNPDDVEAHLVLADVLSREGKTQDTAMEHAGQARVLAGDTPKPLAAMGIVAKRAGNDERALEHFNELTRTHPTYIEGWLFLGQCLMDRQKKEMAEKAYHRALEQDPNNSHVFVKYLDLLKGMGTEEALALISRLNSAVPECTGGWTLKGYSLRHLGRRQEAEEAYGEALEQDPDEINALKGQGVLLRDSGRLEEALALFQRWNKVAPDDSEGWSHTGYVLQSLSRSRAAEEAYNKGLDLDPDNTHALRGLGNAMGGAGRLEEALTLFQRLNESAPNDSDGWMRTGEVLCHLDRASEAKEAYAKALELNPDNILALRGQGIIMGESGRFEEASALLQRLDKLAANNSARWSAQGDVLRKLGKIREAEDAYGKALDLNPDNVHALEGQGILAGKGGRHKEALTKFKGLNKLVPRYPDGWKLTGDALKNLGNVVEAEQAYDQARELNPDNVRALEAQGALVGMAGRHEEALVLFRSLNKLIPRYSDGWKLTGDALMSIGNVVEAEQAYNKALELNPDNVRALEGQGALVGMAGRHEEALALFQRLNKADPGHSGGWRLTGDALRTLERNQEAAEAYHRAVKLSGDNGLAWAGLVVSLDGLERDSEAREALDRAQRLGIDIVDLQNSRGAARRRRGDNRGAVLCFEKALEVDPGAVGPRFNAVSTLVAMGRIEEALQHLPLALEACKGIENPTVAIQGFQNNNVELFTHVAESALEPYLVRAKEIIDSAGYLESLELSLLVTVFALLLKHESISEKRFRRAAQVIQNVMSDQKNVQIAVRFMRVGIDHFKKQDRKALLRLTREERNVFCGALGIENPGQGS